MKSALPGAHGIHFTAVEFMTSGEPQALAAASCHTRAELEQR